MREIYGREPAFTAGEGAQSPRDDFVSDAHGFGPLALTSSSQVPGVFESLMAVSTASYVVVVLGGVSLMA